jgi:hypothetical protein
MRLTGFCEIVYLVTNTPASDHSLGSEVYIYRHNENMIAIVATRRTVSFSPQIEPSIFIFWEKITYCSRKYPFTTAFILHFKEMLAKGKTGRSISYRDSRLTVQSADRRLVNKHDAAVGAVGPVGDEGPSNLLEKLDKVCKQRYPVCQVPTGKGISGVASKD